MPLAKASFKHDKVDTNTDITETPVGKNYANNNDSQVGNLRFSIESLLCQEDLE